MEGVTVTCSILERDCIWRPLETNSSNTCNLFFKNLFIFVTSGISTIQAFYRIVNKNTIQLLSHHLKIEVHSKSQSKNKQKCPLYQNNEVKGMKGAVIGNIVKKNELPFSNLLASLGRKKGRLTKGQWKLWCSEWSQNEMACEETVWFSKISKALLWKVRVE